MLYGRQDRGIVIAGGYSPVHQLRLQYFARNHPTRRYRQPCPLQARQMPGLAADADHIMIHYCR